MHPSRRPGFFVEGRSEDIGDALVVHTRLVLVDAESARQRPIKIIDRPLHPKKRPHHCVVSLPASKRCYRAVGSLGPDIAISPNSLTFLVIVLCDGDGPSTVSNL